MELLISTATSTYTIAGLMVEEVSGQSFSDYVTQHIFEPLDMHHTHTALQEIEKSFSVKVSSQGR